MIVSSKEIGKNYIQVSGSSEFTCNECGHTGKPNVSSPAGMVEMDEISVKKELKDFPTKIIYAVCPVCGMEYVVHLVADNLYLEPSEEEK